MSTTMTTYLTTTGRTAVVAVRMPWAGQTAPCAFDGSALIAFDSHKNDRPGSGEVPL